MRRCPVGALVLSAAALAAMLPAHAARSKKDQAVTASPAAAAPATEPLGTAGLWTAYASHDKTGRVCYLVGRPQKSEPSGFARKEPMAMVTHRPAENIANVISFVEGYPLKEGGVVALAIGDKKFDLFTKDDSAWARTSELDRAIVAALDKGKNAVVKGVPQKGPPTSDIYALAGFAKALALIDKACGIKREDTASPPSHAPPHRRAKPRQGPG